MRTTTLRLLTLPAAIAMTAAACGHDNQASGDSCLSVCDTPPVAFCVGSTLRSFASPGACDASGECAYPSVDVPCAAGCVDGACAGDPCAGVECVTPPDACSSATGVCQNGVCSYTALAGASCDDGDGCTATDSCGDDGLCRGTPVACDSPPPAVCSDATTLTVFAAAGVCADGQCDYTQNTVSCGSGCLDGACVGDPCAGVVCDTPPSPCHEATGVCQSGICEYAGVEGLACDDGDACSDGDTCRADGQCHGTPRACVNPPETTCGDATTLTVYSPEGSCTQDGSCFYAPVAVDCGGACNDGACATDPCAGVVCDSPPSGCHQPTGLCTDGLCSYAHANGVGCEDGIECTTEDACINGSCVGTPVVCESSPSDSCLDANTLLVHDAIGYCDDSACIYETTEIPCPAGCSGNACVGDPCTGVVCDAPPGPCYAATGSCQSGVCSYAPAAGSCDDGDPCTTGDTCSAGTCSGTNVVCDAPPATVCSDAMTLSVPDATGTCTGGSCGYGETAVACANGCVDGACAGDPCTGIVCDTPGAPTCSGATTLVTPAATGTCSGGACSYAPTSTDCHHGCEDGACLPPDGLVINELLYNSQGFPDTDAFIELHGAPGTDLSGLSIVAVNGNGGTDYETIDLDGVINANGLFVVAHPDSAAATAGLADQTTSDIDLQNGPDSVQLRFGASVLDALAYGDFGGSSVAAGEGTPHPGAPADSSLSRDADSTDTNDNSLDFALGMPSPGALTPPVTVEPLVAAMVCPSGSVVANTPVPFHGWAASGGPVTAWLWDFGNTLTNNDDGTVETSYASPGQYTVTLTLTADSGTDAATCMVNVVAASSGDVAGPSLCGAAAVGGFVTHTFTGVAEAQSDVLLTSRYRGDAATSPAYMVWELLVDPATNSWLGPYVSDDVTQVNGDLLMAINVPSATFNSALAANGGDIVIRRSGLLGPNDCDELSLSYTAVPPTQGGADFEGDEQCFDAGQTYLYTVFSSPPVATSDGQLTVRFKGQSPYGPRSYDIQLETAPNQWTTVATTIESLTTFRQQPFPLTADVINDAIAAVGWLRFRHSAIYSSAGGNCTQISLAYNCPGCFECPAGEVDLGIGCESESQPYDFTALDHHNGLCTAFNWREFTFPGVPQAGGDGTLTFDFLPCDGGSVDMQLETSTVGWVDIGSGSTSASCGWSAQSWTVPEGYIDAAITSDNRLRFRFEVDDGCQPGVGCSSHSDPCGRRATLTFPRE